MTQCFFVCLADSQGPRLYTLRLQITDVGHPVPITVNVTVLVTITDANDPPQPLGPFSLSIYENPPYAIPITQLGAHDDDGPMNFT